MRKIILAAAVLAPFTLSAPAALAAGADAYYGNSLLCKSGSAVCQLWLNQDGSYQVFYDSGKKAYVKGVEGPFENEGRQGTYTATPVSGGLNICLTPEVDNPPRPRGSSPALFHDAGCVTVPDHPLGEVWDFTYQGENYKMGLIKGR